MIRLFTALGDRLLGMFLGSVEAGACVPEHGDRCTRVGRVNCYGHCAV
jgi:hypothetical protein